MAVPWLNKNNVAMSKDYPQWQSAVQFHYKLSHIQTGFRHHGHKQVINMINT
jgi:hypothetical protein